MGLYSQFINFAKLASQFFGKRFNRNVYLQPEAKTSREGARRGQWSKAIARRRRKTELAKQSRRINWQVAKGISIRG